MGFGSFARRNFLGLTISAIALLIFLAGIYTDWLWFDSLGYLEVYKTILVSKIMLGIGIFALFFIILYLNFLIIRKRAKVSMPRLYISLIAVISVVAGLIASSYWFNVLRFMNFASFGFIDPVFKTDMGFYIFILPFYNFILVILLSLVLACLLISAVAYLLSSRTKKAVKQDEDAFGFAGMQQIRLSLPDSGKAHLSYIIGVLMLVIAAFFFFRRYYILFSERGVVYGAGFTDVNIMLPLFIILSAVSVITALIAFAYSYTRNFRLLGYGIVLVAVMLFAGNLVAGLVQKLYVEPNEFNLEETYLKQNIKHTIYAYGLSDVQIREFPVSYDLTMQEIKGNKATTDNIRLWDWRPLLMTNKQIQLFRTYYDFIDVDVDRYTVDNKIRQLMLAPRELDQAQLDRKAQTWVNQKFVYTHGYGIVVSPVNEVSDEGLPELFVKDIPPKSSYGVLEVAQPRIYFGEKTDGFVVTNTKSREFDYPLGDENVFAVYNGSDGVQLSNFIRKGAFSIKLSSLNLFISSALTKDSKVLMNRKIMERINALAPFLKYDSDPYMVINNGKLFWMLDAYTTTNRFPYSEAVSGINYIRNSVKVVVDAYNGDVTFYVMDISDPLIANYREIFPSLFRDFKDMDPGLKEHIRYPEDMFRVQAGIYGTYHMLDPQVFYNKEDVWRVPTEVYSGTQVEMTPYYIILELPDAENEGFFLINPLVPRGKENMIAWLSAHSDPESYGKLEVFTLSKQELIFGPMQIEARINQDTEIAQLFTLWNQQGSEVIRGNLIIIPIEESFLYIEPVYLKASASGALPQLKRIIVAYQDQVAMEESLEEALDVIFKGKIGDNGAESEGNDIPQESQSLEEKFRTASQLYNEAQQALQQGDFATYAMKIEELGRLLSNE